MSVKAFWTLNCQGKQDFDGPIIEVSTRYWPRGGGFTVFDSSTGRFQENDERPEVRPSAHCSIVIRDVEEDHDHVLIEHDFEEETEGDVKRAVEEWANSQRERIIAALNVEFGTNFNP